MITFIAGDDILRRFQLENFNGSGAPDLTVPGTSVSAGIFTKKLFGKCIENNGSLPLIPLTPQSASTLGAQWALGIVAVSFANALTVNLPHGEVFLEIQALLGGTVKCSAIKPVWILRGL